MSIKYLFKELYNKFISNGNEETNQEKESRSLLKEHYNKFNFIDITGMELKKSVLGSIKMDFDFVIDFDKYEKAREEDYFLSLEIEHDENLQEFFYYDEKGKKSKELYKLCAFEGVKALCFVEDVPIFDSGDCEFDKWHLLYIFKSLSGIGYDACYVKKGYNIGCVYFLRNFININEDLKDLLRKYL